MLSFTEDIDCSGSSRGICNRYRTILIKYYKLGRYASLQKKRLFCFTFVHHIQNKDFIQTLMLYDVQVTNNQMNLFWYKIHEIHATLPHFIDSFVFYPILNVAVME